MCLSIFAIITGFHAMRGTVATIQAGSIISGIVGLGILFFLLFWRDCSRKLEVALTIETAINVTRWIIRTRHCASDK